MAGKINKTSHNIPGGSVKQLQFNDTGLFGGCSQLFWDKTNDRFGIGKDTPSERLEISGGNLAISHATGPPTLYFKDLVDDDWFTLFHNRAGNRFSISSNDLADIFVITKAGLVGLGDATPAQQLSITKCVKLLDTSGSGVGVIYKGATRFIHNYGTGNLFVGKGSGNFSLTGQGNTGIGSSALDALTSGGHNICIGYQAGDNITSGDKNIVIGYDLNALSATADNQLNIASLIFGDLGATKKLGVNTSTLNETLNVDGAIRLGTSALTNNGTIRWTGTDFEGYNGGWQSLTGGGFSDGGEAGGAARTLGNTDNFHLGLKTNDTVRLHINNDGSIGINKTTSLGTKLDVDGNFRSWYTCAGSGAMEVCGTHRMLVTGSSLSSDFFAGWVINVGPTSSASTRNVVGMELNVQESEGDQGLKGQRTGKSSTILQIVPESQFDSRSGYNVSFGVMFSRGSHTGNPRMHVGIVAEQFAIAHQGDFMLLHGGSSTGDRPNAAMDLRDNWLCGIDTSDATLSYAFKTKNNQPFVSRNAANNATKELIRLASDNQVQVGFCCTNYVNLGQGSSSNNPVRIRIGGTNDKTITEAAADSGGAGYRMLLVPN